MSVSIERKVLFHNADADLSLVYFLYNIILNQIELNNIKLKALG